MSLHPPNSTATALAKLDAAGIAIVEQHEGWFIKFYQLSAGPYDTPQAALEASTYWLAADRSREVAGDATIYPDES